MIMMADVSECAMPFAEFSDKLSALGDENGLHIHVMNEDILIQCTEYRSINYND
jgi:predicted amino acid-binding ACT domain protein